ncbi:HNH endonuclease family protein [Gordonia sp. PP30]|uniref:HNH endonuclease family protein n=1 Tax=unclassified Gordonia (in: high G+C Gram-positive bacteria) TaxID=2657482 RepID=UPI00200021AB|nr:MULTISPECIES: HNH endonuclease family protein [unclassified Gordonia (in: high G+C Gram-positive bacteria)]UQE73892.1 HNH endonuclease family protein [Gordonia sp. PP30]
MTLRRDIERRLATRRHVRHDGRIRLTGRHWASLTGFAATAVIVAAGIGWHSAPGAAVDPVRVRLAREALATLSVVPRRPPHDTAYHREAFGPAWTDAAGVPGAGNGCDTRNDVLARDLAVAKSVAAQTCRSAVAAGRFRSPYTGREITFARGRGSAAVQIDHIVPLAYAWDMGAASWEPARRVALANDPANLVAVDAASNQAKSDLEPGRWMPPLRGFACQYAMQFATVSAAYDLPVDERSRDVLAAALGKC